MAEAVSGPGLVVELTEDDVPGASLDEPMERQSVPALKRWLLCRGIEMPTSTRKKQLLERVKDVKARSLPVIDVDGGCLARKWHRLSQEGMTLEPLPIPQPPPTGWEVLNEGNLPQLSTKIPKVSHGTMYEYLSSRTGHDEGSKTFRALYRGYNHWASGRVDKIEVNTENPFYCFVRSSVTPSMKPGSYKVCLLLSCGPAGYGEIKTGSCQCAAGLSATCVHISAILHALVSLNPSSQPNPSLVVPIEADSSVPVTSLINSWKPPRKRKESTMMMSEANFQKHTYGKKTKHHRSPLESFDPRPEEYRGTASASLERFLQATKGMGLCTSLLFDKSARVWKPPGTANADVNERGPTPLEYSIPSKKEIEAEVTAFKESLAVSEADICRIERETREQRDSLKWFQWRRFRITASHFGEIRRRRDTTPPEALVLRLLGADTHQRKDTASMAWGRSNESLALEKYKQEKLRSGNENFVLAQSGLWVSPDYPFLGATPDASIYDPSESQAFGFVEVKCPYKHKDVTPTDACSDPTFCCKLVMRDGVEQLTLKESHPYYSQVQGQMAVGRRTWNDFVIFTTKRISIKRIYFNELFWEKELLPKLVNFYDCCLGPEILHPMHAVGLPVRDLSKE